ncbi:MBL fold metallo-hydrolase [Paenibacillus ginsengarvi]|uniref:MBL fold metallo-hydrolase n=1 Tax=Paenibacillus ginsengarvi TaxID=400777 RepID=A0A3B0BCY5_9BACL|nr:MBL fold metallo-hydrolase [Paenibacillus ginsengarvi]RKN70630.1 MBL fold metallo-hydrolase [Paenibacillus ginsengarvi]
MPLRHDWFTVEQVDADTYAISEYGHWEQVHAYLLLGERLAALIDTGIGIADMSEVVRQLTRLPVKVITTHVHWDHIGSHGQFDEIYVHEQEEDWLRCGIPGLPIEQIRHDVGRDITIPVPADFSLDRYEPFRGKPTGLIRDGDTLDLGNRALDFIHTPGHSPGHLCIYEEKRGYLYTADLIYKGTLYAFYPTTDPRQFVRSVEKVSRLPFITRLLPGHLEMDLNRAFLLEVSDACRQLAESGLDRHGSGVHRFGSFSIYF